MSPDELTYLAILICSIPVGFLFKNASPQVKQLGGAAVGLLLTLITCQIHVLHSVVTIIGIWLILKLSPRSCHFLALGWTFTYLLFFRTVTYFGIPVPTPFTNAVQLLLTLKLVSLANEVQEFCRSKKQEMTSFSKHSVVGVIPSIPSLAEIFFYSYCYVGLMTGPFYRYKTYYDWLHQLDSPSIPSWKPLITRLKPAPVFGVLFLLVSYYFPLDYVKTDEFYDSAFLFRLFYMVPIFFVFRMRFYVAWIFSECGCIAAAFGAYPVAAKSRSGGGPTVEYSVLERNTDGSKVEQQYDYETVKNIDCYGTDFCVKVKDGMRYWNMSVQWWLAQYIYKNSPVKSFVFGNAWTMLISAYWHGIHPGYYLSFLTIPLCLASEGAMEFGLRRRLSDSGKMVFDWVHWFLKMRAYDYMCMGFVLLTFSDTVRYWRSIYFLIHVVAVFILITGWILSLNAPRSPKSRQEKAEIKPESPQQETKQENMKQF
ncbi:lysophospholipid acyltransferase 7 [Bombina bombina]|uniref:lysophospholipid acyltransferase 7 n=1 Tax=Bombina bombina TaxID=8345 RepID=UPI00235AF41C|nr:lysophospholipid acyltransferase 7 [Bombina bombina]XP_053546708.1 lysophospholipid acyltransferase 7 [Bombina bombina]XP_053546709.1 lysophospholipid acyltransferase 7 [Bombina bombina]